MSETLSKDTSVPVRFETSGDQHFMVKEHKDHSMHTYKEVDGRQKHVSGDEMAEYMQPGILKDRQEYKEKNAPAAREWRSREKAGTLISNEGRNKGRLLTSEGKLAFPTKKDKVVGAGKKVTDLIKDLSNETKDKFIEAYATGQLDEVKRLLEEHGIKLGEEDLAETKVNKKEQTNKEAETGKETGPAIFTNRKKEKIKVNITGLSDKYPEGINSDSGKKYYKGVGENGIKYEHLLADRVEFLDEAAADGKTDQEEDHNKNGELAAPAEDIRRMQKDFEKKYRQAFEDQTILDLNDPSIRDSIQDQIRSKIVDEYIEGLPEDKKKDKDDLKKRLLEDMKRDSEELEGIKSPKEFRIKGRDHNGQPYIIRGWTDGRPLQINRNVDKNWNVVSEKGWFNAPNGLEMDVMNPPDSPNGNPPPSKTEKESKNGKKHEESDDDTVDTEAMEASMARQQAILVELEKPDLTAERRAELLSQLKVEQAKQREIWNKAPSSDPNEETKPIDPADAPKRRRDKIWEWIRHPGRKTMAAVQTKTTERDRTDRDRRGVAGLATGALVGGGLFALGWVLHKNGQPSHITNDIINNFCNGRGSSGGAGHHHALVEGLPKGIHYEKLTIHHGNWHDTIWNHVARRTSHGGNVDANTQRILNMNSAAIWKYHQAGDKSLWDACHHLPEHFRFKMPNHF